MSKKQNKLTGLSQTWQRIWRHCKLAYRRDNIKRYLICRWGLRLTRRGRRSKSRLGVDDVFQRWSINWLPFNPIHLCLIVTDKLDCCWPAKDRWIVPVYHSKTEQIYTLDDRPYSLGLMAEVRWLQTIEGLASRETNVKQKTIHSGLCLYQDWTDSCGVPVLIV